LSVIACCGPLGEDFGRLAIACELTDPHDSAVGNERNAKLMAIIFALIGRQHYQCKGNRKESELAQHMLLSSLTY
jgi:hypothetical protein